MLAFFFHYQLDNKVHLNHTSHAELPLPDAQRDGQALGHCIAVLGALSTKQMQFNER